MAVGKARTRAENSDGEAFHFVVPCYADIDENVIKDHLKRDQFFWLDLTAPNQEKLAKLGELFGFHPLALEDAEEWHQRPKLDNYGNYVVLVFYGAEKPTRKDRAPLLEVHLFISGHYMITVHRDPLPLFEDERQQLDGQVMHSEQFLIYRVLDALTTASFRSSRTSTTRSTTWRPRCWPTRPRSSSKGCSP